ncbi:hypothetical protein ABTE60_21115, partial [Acinetobacter baumannii]
TSLALAAGNFLLSGFVTGQGTGATLAGVTSGSFNSKNVAEANLVTASLSGATLTLASGDTATKASNYKLAESVSKAGSISQATLTV